MDDVNTRIERLERSNRRIAMTLIAVLLGGISFVLVGASHSERKPGDTVRAGHFVLEDDEGKEQALNIGSILEVNGRYKFVSLIHD